MAASLHHPNIVPIFDVDDRGGMVHLAMAYIPGESVAQRLHRERRLPVQHVRRIVADVAAALDWAHSHGVIHRDVKPDNILLDEETGRAVVTDFGVARAMESDERLTATGVAMGTPAYMSPEQAMGERALDGRSDIYGLGVVAYQMLAGAPPFTAPNTPALLLKHIGESPRQIRTHRGDVPESVAEAIHRALAKKPEHRFESAAEMRDAMLGVARPVSVRTQPDPPAPVPPSIPVPEKSRANGHEARLAITPVKRPPRAQRPPDLEPPSRPPATSAPAGLVPASRRRPLAESKAPSTDGPPDETAVDRRIRLFRMKVAGYGGMVAMLGGVNLVTSPWVPWFIIPALGMGYGIARQVGGFWADGIPLSRVFGRPAPGAKKSGSRDSAGELAALLPPEVRSGPHGATVKDALEDRAAIRELVRALPEHQRTMLPEVEPTVNALVERAVALARLLHQLDQSLPPDLVTDLRQRLAAAEAEPEGSAERERRLELLRRQEISVGDLGARRSRVSEQLESVSGAMRTLRFDLVRLRGAGADAALDELAGATGEASAISRDIVHAVEAARQARSEP